jgi:predicted benzoate:H+ symporter BenE
LRVSARIGPATIGALALRLPASRTATLITFHVPQNGVVISNVGLGTKCVVVGSLALFVQQYAQRPAARRH